MSEPSSLDIWKSLESRAIAELAICPDESSLRAWNTKFFGDKGEVPHTLRQVSTIPPTERKSFGQEGNRVKELLTSTYESRLLVARESALEQSLRQNPFDVTLPGRSNQPGRVHVATRVMRDINRIFAEMGFQVFRSREVEDDLLNFELLNMPPHHPARDMWDTFYTNQPGVVLRTHTSPGQIHVMRQFAPNPIRAVLPGMCYRNEAISTRSEIQFQQVEGLVVGPNVTMADLIGTITTFARRLFGQERQIRIRSSYFPFTEPSIEVDIDWPKEDPNADRLTKGTGWLEIMGAGMVHPTVLKNGGYDPDQVTGFAFGMGPQRITMLKHAIDDIREFWKNDLRFLEQF
jgi:phenylalanyl-tRNA synthetase alpha chain